MRRLSAMIIKELWALWRDPKARVVLILPPLIQLFVFTYAATLEVRNVDLGLLNASSGRHSSALIAGLQGSPNIRSVQPIATLDELHRAIDLRRVVGVVVLEPDFDAKLDRGEDATAGLVLDGRRSNAAQIVAGYVSQIAAGVGAQARMLPPTAGSVVTNWYNPGLDFTWFNLPSLVAIVISVAGLSITSLSVARERELGTFDQLMVSPIRVHEILLGKIVPPFIVGMLNALIYLVVAQSVFGVPFTGSVLLFFLGMAVYLLALIGIGLFTSSASRTQQQAFLGSFMVTVPLILLSGYASPIDNMPDWLQIVTYANPARYALIITQGLFLKDLSAAAVFGQIGPLVIISIITLGAAARLFRARLE